MPGKLRVHELAKKLEITSKELLATLKEQGEFVKTASSTVEPPVVKKMEKFYADKRAAEGAGDGDAQQSSAKAADSKAAKKPAASAAPKPGAKPAAKPAAAEKAIGSQG